MRQSTYAIHATPAFWSRYDRDKSDGTEKSKVDGLHALSSFEYPDFARATRTGQATFDKSGTFYLPVTGNSGLVEMMVAGTLRQEVCVPRRAMRIERLIGVMRGLRPTLAQLLERLAFRREKQFRQRMLQRVKVTDSAVRSLFGNGRSSACQLFRACYPRA